MKARNFFLSAVLLALVLGGSYYYFETHNLLASFGYHKYAMYALWYAIGGGTICLLYAIATKRGTNSFLYWNTLQLNFVGVLGITYYMYYYGTLFMRGKVLMYVIAIIALFVLQTIVLLSNRKSSAK